MGRQGDVVRKEAAQESEDGNAGRLFDCFQKSREREKDMTRGITPSSCSYHPLDERRGIRHEGVASPKGGRQQKGI